MRYVEVTTQKQLDALKPDEIAVVRSGRFVAWGSSHVEARESSHVEARESSHVVARESSHVVARESSHVVARGSSHVVAWESSHVVARGSSHVVAWGSSHVVAWGSSHVVARESSHVVAWGSSHVVARESSHVVARESSHVEASKFVAVHDHGPKTKVKGGVIIVVKIDTPQDWCDLYGIPVKRGKAVLYKAVEDDWRGSTKVDGITYRPGDKPVAPDFTPEPYCGQGLHLTPHPRLSRDFCYAATHYLACQVDVAEIIVIDSKIKVKTCKVLYEVDIDGNRLDAAVA